MTDRYRAPRRRAGAELVIKRLAKFAALKASDVALLNRLDDWRHDPPGVELVRETVLSDPRLLVAGWAARMRWLADGRRQILSFILPGDGLGLCRRPHPIGACTVVALTPVQTLGATPLMRAVISHDEGPLSTALHTAAAMDEQALMDQVVRMGRMTAYERVAHLICELRHRMTAIDLGADEQYPFPLTQEMLADATGLSIVHMNRTLQQLRRDEIIDLHAGRLTILDVQDLEDAAGFQSISPAGHIQTFAWIIRP